MTTKDDEQALRIAKEMGLIDETMFLGNIKRAEAVCEFARRLRAEWMAQQEPVACPDCDGRGWYAAGATDDPVQVQCATCQGSGRLLLPTTAPVAKSAAQSSLTDEEILSIAARETDTLDAMRVHEQRGNGWHATTMFDGDTALLRFARALLAASKEPK